MEIMSAQTAGMNRDTELRSMWGLYGVIGPYRWRRLGYDSISHGFHLHRHSTDDCGKLNHSVNFDEECRKIHTRAQDSASAYFDVAAYHQRARDLAMLQLRRARMDSADDFLVDSRRARRNKKRNDDNSSFYHLASTSGEMPMNKLALAARNFQEESILSQFFKRGIHHGNCDAMDGISMQMNAKFFVDQVFLARKYIHEAGMRSKSNSFTSAQRGHLEEPDFCSARLVKSSAQRPLPNVASKLVADKGLTPGSSKRKVSMLSSQNGELSKVTEKIVIQNPVDNVFEGISCCCSSKTSKTSKGRNLNTKSHHFFIQKMQKMLKHAFEGTARDIRLLSGSCSSDGLSESGRSSLVKIRDSCTSSNKRGDPSRKNVNKNHQCRSNVMQAVSKEKVLSRVKKHKLDILSEATRQLSLRWNNRQYEERLLSNKSSKALLQILSSHEADFWSIGILRDFTSGSSQMGESSRTISGRIMDSSTHQGGGREIARLCALASETEVSSSNDCYKWEPGSRAKANSQAWKPDEMIHNIDHFMRENVNLQGKKHGSHRALRCCESTRKLSIFGIPKGNRPQCQQRLGVMQSDLHKESPLHSILDSVSEIEASTSTTDDFSSTSSSIHQLSDGLEHHKEHRSPTSVLEPFGVENAVSSPGELQHLHLLFEDECSLEAVPENKPRVKSLCLEDQNHLSQYVHIVLQVSGLNWNKLLEIDFTREQILKDSLFEEVDFIPDHCYLDSRLLFDHINEVLMMIHQSHLTSIQKLPFLKLKAMTTPLAEAVIDQIMTEEDFYFLPRTNGRTLDQLVSEDVRKCTSWLDIQVDMETVVHDISEDVLSESLLDIFVEFVE